MKDISKLPTFNQKNILVIVAHPDDECLYFYGGLRSLGTVSSVTVLSVTQSALTVRGRELRSFCQRMNLACDFLSLPDRGIQSTLPDFREDLADYLSRHDFDMIITHPPHGGEKPHPHHLQTLLTAFSHCLRYQVKFAFFSESRNSLCEPTRLDSLLKMRLLPLVALYVLRTTYALKWRYKFSWLQFLLKDLFKVLFELKSQRKLFFRFEIDCPLEEKKISLRHYTTQVDVLDSYRTSSSGEEYLFLLTGFRLAQDGTSIGTENFLKDHHEFKVSTAFRAELF